MNYPSHKNEISRINRAIGQMDGIKKMIDANRNCVDILIQLKAVKSAIKSIERNILKTHLDHCVKESFNEKNSEEKIAEIKSLLDKFQD